MKNKPSNAPVRRADPLFRAAGASPPPVEASEPLHELTSPLHPGIARRMTGAEAKPGAARPPVMPVMPVMPEMKPGRGPTPLETLHGALRRRIALARPSPPSQ